MIDVVLAAAIVWLSVGVAIGVLLVGWWYNRNSN